MKKRGHGNFQTIPMKPGERILARPMLPENDPAPGGSVEASTQRYRSGAKRWYGMILESTPLVPEAQHVFADCFEDHLAGIAERVRREEPVTRGSASAAQCWACNAHCPTHHLVGASGWYSRPMPGDASTKEIYCVKCFKEWGWGDE